MLHTLTVDPSLGRLSYESLSDQALMEMLIEGTADSTKRHFQDNNGAYLDVCEWSGTTCDASDNVVSFAIKEGNRWNIQFDGTLALEYLPKNLLFLFMCNTNSISSGTLQTALLPSKLRRFCVTRHKLSGTVDMTALPKHLQLFSIKENVFSGSCDLRNLPENIESVNVSENNFSGSLHLDKLPSALIHLFVQKNEFTGGVDLENLPKALEELDISDTQLSGEFRLTPPDSLRQVRAHNTDFSGTAVVKEGKHFDAWVYAEEELMRVFLYGTSVSAVETPSGERHPYEEWILKGENWHPLMEEEREISSDDEVGLYD